MYLDNVKLFEIEEYVDNLQNIFAHLKDKTVEKEKLIDHIKLSHEYLILICKEKNLDNVFKNMECKFFEGKNKNIIDMWKQMIVNTIYMHDLGKINPAFQYDVMKNELYKDNSSQDRNHSLLSSYIYISYFSRKIKQLDIEKLDKKFLRYFMYMNSYIISKHHGCLDEFEKYMENLSVEVEEYCRKDYFPDLNMDMINNGSMNNFIRNTLEYMEEYMKKNGEEFKFAIYIYSKLIFSLLTASDYYSTSQYMNGEKTTDLGTITDKLKERFDDDFNNSNIAKGIREYEKNIITDGNYTSINQLRSEITLESEKTYLKNKDKNIYYLEAPTGAGKTVTSINLARLILNSDNRINKLFYIFPFNTLVEQTKKSLFDIFEKDKSIKENISVINSITPIKTIDKEERYTNVIDKDNGKEIDYEKSLLNRIFLNYPFIITTHINLFNFLFGVSREEVFPLINLCNSVIILDEIQSYKNGIWKEIINFLSEYAEILNIKVIIMSATLPRLNKLVEGDNNNFIYLIKNRDHYFKNPKFKDRVEFEMFDLPEDSMSSDNEAYEVLFDDILNESMKCNKILVEFIFKKRADGFFKYANNNKPYDFKHEVKIITSDDNKTDRNITINMAKQKNKKIIIVATQVIEAGIDIDMDLGYKNISILDAEEQFMGRVNRSCSKKGKVKFFKLDDCKIIYNNDVRNENYLTLNNPEVQKLLKDKNFEDYYEKVIDKLEERKKRNNDNNYSNLIDKLKLMNFAEIKKYMKLIDDKNKFKYTIFISRKLKKENEKILDGNIVWENYKKILMDNKMKYTEKRVKLSMLNEDISYFIYRVEKIPEMYNDILGDIFYIANGENYVVDGRFNSEKFNNNSFI